MKRYTLLLLTLISMSAIAQSKFGYVSYKEILKSLPEYTIVEKDLADLQGKYEAEIVRSEREFNQKYAEFIEDQVSLPENLRLKRHTELQELMEKSIRFKDEINRTIVELRHEMLQPLHEKIDNAVMKICVDEGYDYILNTDERAYIAINPKHGKDITAKLKKELGIDK